MSHMCYKVLQKSKMVLQRCYEGVTNMLQMYHTGVTMVVSQRCDKDGKADGQTGGRQTDRQTGREVDRQTYAKSGQAIKS
jgi:hypothetical protein